MCISAIRKPIAARKNPNAPNPGNTNSAGAGSHADLTINLRGTYLIRN